MKSRANTELVTGTGRATLSRTGGGAGYGAYALLYTTRPINGYVEAIIAATRPEDTNPTWNLATPRRYGPQTSETRPLLSWAAALNDPRADIERLAQALLTTALSTRTTPPPGTIDLPAATWTVETQRLVPLVYAGHTAVRIGRLISITDAEA